MFSNLYHRIQPQRRGAGERGQPAEGPRGELRDRRGERRLRLEQGHLRVLRQAEESRPG
jgi:hypothetical protein